MHKSSHLPPQPPPGGRHRAAGGSGRRRGWRLGLAVAMGQVTACQAVDSLRQALHDDRHPDARPQAIAADRAGLRVEVVPARGISLILDGRAVAQASPWEHHDLSPELHSLQVRAMGYLPVTLNVQLRRGQLLTLPVALRQRGEAPPTVPPTRPPPPAEAPAPAPPAIEPLPPTLAPVTLRASGRPPLELWVDGAASRAGAVVRLGRRRGGLRVGQLSVSYQVADDRALQLLLPEDGGSWSVDGTMMHGAAQLVVPASPMRLRRQGLDGDDQTLILRRLD